MKNISMIGGDNRNLILSNLLEKEGYNIFRYGLDMQNKYNLEECINKSNIIITAIPFSTDFENIYNPLYNGKININDFINISKHKKIVGGNISKLYTEELEKNNNIVVDFMKQEQFVIMNTIPTAEGIVKIIIENTDITVHNSKIAILGFGRVGKSISKLLYGMGANVYCIDTKKDELANISWYGYNTIKNIYTDLADADIIINTIPSKIITEEVLNCINKKALIVDISSKPGGVDFEYANKNGYNVIHALGLPGKVAPVTSAKYMKEIVENLII